MSKIRNLVFVNNMFKSTSGLMDMSTDPPSVFCYCKLDIGQEIIEKFSSTSTIVISNESLQDRKLKFSINLQKYSDEYPLGMLEDFLEHWCEHSEGHKKMRFEKEKSFDLSKRLKSWQKRNFNGNCYFDSASKETLKIGRQDIETIKKNASNWEFK